MARIKYDINLKPIRDTHHYQVRFTSKEAMDTFVKIARLKGIYKTGVVCHVLGEWKPIVNEMVDVIKYNVDLGKFSLKAEWASNDDWAHALAS